MLSSIRPYYFRASHGDPSLKRPEQEVIDDKKLAHFINRSRKRRDNGLDPKREPKSGEQRIALTESAARSLRKGEDPRQLKKRHLTQLELSARQAARSNFQAAE